MIFRLSARFSTLASTRQEYRPLRGSNLLIINNSLTFQHGTKSLSFCLRFPQFTKKYMPQLQKEPYSKILESSPHYSITIELSDGTSLKNYQLRLSQIPKLLLLSENSRLNTKNFNLAIRRSSMVQNSKQLLEMVFQEKQKHYVGLLAPEQLEIVKRVLRSSLAEVYGLKYQFELEVDFLIEQVEKGLIRLEDQEDSLSKFIV